MRGTLLGFNLSPKGRVEGAVVETTEGLEQVNFPKRSAAAFARSLRVGSTVNLSVELVSEDSGHRVYRAAVQDGEASGKIVRLNYASDGDVNGYHLADSTFLHVKPAEARRYKLNVGEKVRATGTRRQGADTVVLDVLTLERVERTLKHQSNGASATAS